MGTLKAGTPESKRLFGVMIRSKVRGGTGRNRPKEVTLKEPRKIATIESTGSSTRIRRGARRDEVETNCKVGKITGELENSLGNFQEHDQERPGLSVNEVSC